MRRRTEEQIRLKKEVGVVQEPALSETPPSRPLTRNEQEVNDIMKKAEEQMKLRDELLARNSEQIDRYQKYRYSAAPTHPTETNNFFQHRGLGYP